MTYCILLKSILPFLWNAFLCYRMIAMHFLERYVTIHRIYRNVGIPRNTIQQRNELVMTFNGNSTVWNQNVVFKILTATLLARINSVII